MKLQELSEGGAHDPSKVADYIKRIFDQSEDPDWQHIEAHEWIAELGRDFPDMDPRFAKAVAEYLYHWTSSGETEESPPSLGMIKQDLYRFTDEMYS